MTGKSEETAITLTADFGLVYGKVHKGQLMRPARAAMKLFEKKGHIYTIKGKTVISSAGYIQLNKAASVNLVTPKSVIVDGKAENNPYVERNPNTRAIEAVAVRKIGIGFSPIGNITVIDKTLYYNVYTYLIQSIQAKMKKDQRKKDETRCAFVGTAQDKPKTGKYVFYETASPLGIWANYADGMILDCLEEHTQRQRFGDRIAQSIVERNILRDHPAIGTAQVEATGAERNRTAIVTVYGWRHEMGPYNISEILDQAEKGAEELEIKKDIIEPDLEEEKEVIEAEEEAPVEEPPAEEKPEPKTEKSPAEMDEPPADYYEKDKKKKKGELF